MRFPPRENLTDTVELWDRLKHNGHAGHVCHIYEDHISIKPDSGGLYGVPRSIFDPKKQEGSVWIITTER